jgi:hypothetical protein
VDPTSRSGENAIVICADVIGHLLDSEPLLALLGACYRRGAIVISGALDRIR